MNSFSSSGKASFVKYFKNPYTLQEYLISSLTEIINMIDEIIPMLNLALLTSHTFLQQNNPNYPGPIVSPSKLMKVTTELYNSEKAFKESKNLMQFHSSKSSNLDLDTKSYGMRQNNSNQFQLRK